MPFISEAAVRQIFKNRSLYWTDLVAASVTQFFSTLFRIFIETSKNQWNIVDQVRKFQKFQS